MQLQYYSYALVETKQANLGIYPENKNKPEIVKEMLYEHLSEKTFPHYGSTLGFLVTDEIGEYLICTLGKKSTNTIAKSPAEQFKVEHQDDWKRSKLFFFLHPQAQYVAAEYKPSIFSNPLNQLNAIAEQLNIVLLGKGYELIFRPILKEEIFWDAINEYKGSIQKVQFDYVAPNWLNTTSKIHEGLKDYKAKYGITDLSLTLENKEGNLVVPEDDETLKENVEEATKGGGRITVKAKNKIVYSSEKKSNVKSQEVFIEMDLEGGDDATIIEALRKVFEHV